LCTVGQVLVVADSIQPGLKSSVQGEAIPFLRGGRTAVERHLV
jgi:hypothetical protein